VRTAFTAAQALSAQAEAPARVVLLDLMLPDGDGLDVLRRMRGVDRDLKVIVVTADGSVSHAVDAMRLGAVDFLVKPVDRARLLRVVASAFRATKPPPPPQGDAAGYRGFIGGSPEMQAIYRMIEGASPSSATVFITGESGTGKEVCAEAIHAASPRAKGPFVPLNCGAIPRDLLESEVFGHLKGAFTGAIADKQGAAAAAHGGTLFLDEICEMDIDLQAKMLRFLQTQTVQPVGATAPRAVDVRIVCATNRNPQEEVAAGRFRTDLFYRLHVVPIHMPPLRRRGEDVLLIAQALLRSMAKEEGKAFTDLNPEAAQLFLSYGWPGNVRELQNVLRNVVVLNDGAMVTPAMLPERLRSHQAAQGAVRVRAADAPGATLRERLQPFVGETLAAIEREFIETTIAANDGSIPQAARLLDVSPSTLYRKRAAWTKG
jgi:DNA-binding NtrC family response regulator